MLNECVEVGYLATKVTFMSTDTQQHCKFKLAVPRDYKDDKGNIPADFIPCIAFGMTAEQIHLNFEKGDRICLKGRIESSRYQDKSGKKRVDVFLRIEKWYFAEPKTKSLQEYAELFNSSKG